MLLKLAPAVGAFKFMANWKMPMPQDVARTEATAERFGEKKLAIITGTSSGLGKKTALSLLRTGEYHVIGAVRDMDKMAAVAEVDEFPEEFFTPMQVELASFDSVRDFCKKVDEFRLDKSIDRLICNAGVYQPSLPHAKWSADNIEQTMSINYLSHFLMISEFMPSLMKSKEARVIMVGSVTGNDNTVGGGGVYPIADLHELEGFKAGLKDPICMADGYSFDGAKAYKDSKLSLMMLSNTLHAKYNKLTGVAFSSIYPGCIAESPLFREKRGWFRQYFPVFMKFITGGFVGEEEAGQRLFQVAHDPRCGKSGVYWSWNGGPREGRGAEALEKGGQISGGGGAGGGWNSIFENDQSAKVLDMELAMNLFKYSTEVTKAEWPDLKQITSPCPTLNVVGAVSKYMIAKEEMKRIRVGVPGFGADGKPIEISKFKKRQAIADKMVGTVVGNTVGRGFKFIGKRLLGRLPDEALKNSLDLKKTDEPLLLDAEINSSDETSSDRSPVSIAEPLLSPEMTSEKIPAEVSDNEKIVVPDQESLEDEIANQIFSESGIKIEEKEKQNTMST